jgi:hypothetical protein
MRGGVKKPSPLPLRIPTSTHLPRSASESHIISAAPISGRSRPASIDSADAISAISGTTLARAMASSFIYTPDDFNRRSGRKSGLVRQDSATLPRGDHPYLNSPHWRLSKASMGSDHSSLPSSGLVVPPVPPLPSIPVTPEFGLMMGVASGARVRRGSDTRDPSRSSEVKRRSSLTSLHQHADKPSGHAYPRPVSRISEVESPAPSGPSAPNTPQKSLPGSANTDQTPSSASYYGSSEQGSPIPPSRRRMSQKRKSASLTPDRPAIRRSNVGTPSSSGSNDYLARILDEYAGTPSPRSPRASPRISSGSGGTPLPARTVASLRSSRTWSPCSFLLGH